MDSRLAGQRAVCGAIFVAILATPFCRAQSTPAQNESGSPSGTAPGASPVFDVAVIRSNPGDTSGHSHIWSSPADGHFKAQNVTVMGLIQFAYATPETRILGGPGWTRSTKWDTEAKADSTVDEQLRGLNSREARQRKQLMLQALLADRFGLKVHEETRVQPVYVLVVAKGGPRFQPSKRDGTSISNGNGRIAVQGSDHTVALLAEQLAKTLGRVVVDRTGVDGRFDLTLSWGSEDAAPGTAASLAANAPSLFTAIQEQLGLKLESERGPVPILVIDHLEMPSEN
jgi:uncharacterized protein (TIGR03435 family)